MTFAFRLRILLTCAAACAFTATAIAWGPEGHRITGEIAAAHLTDESNAAIENILGNANLARATTWADEVRDRREHEWTMPLHYINVPRSAGSINMDRDCENGLCVVGAIRDFEKKLRDPQTPLNERRDALRFLIHFIGDIHQPMHVSYRDDLGGNQIDVVLFGEQSNLHRVWDTGLIRGRLGEGGIGALSQELNDAITPELKAQWTRSLDPVIWANESLSITQRIYKELPRGGELGQPYYERNIGDVLERLAMAGIRMAAMLNDIFDSDDSKPDKDDVKDDEQEDAETNPALDALRIVTEESCGHDGGNMMYLRNGDESRTIEAIVRQSWEDRGRARSTERTIVVRPGDANKQRLGCSRQSAGEARAFTWEVIDARFR